MKLTCYVTSTSPWFLYAASVSFVFLLLREQQPRHCGVTTELSSFYGVDRPCRVLLHHHYVRALPFNAKYGEKSSGADWSPFDALTSLYWVARNSRKCEGENTKLVARLPSKCHPGTSFPLAGLASKSDRDKSYCKLKHFLHRKKKKPRTKLIHLYPLLRIEDDRFIL